MAQFSNAVKLADLNDYLGPSQSCVKPMMKERDEEKGGPSYKANPNQGHTVRIELEVDAAAPPRSRAAVPVAGSKGFGQIRVDKEKKTATVSLNDCLACSGCVTSAETVLIQQQSLEQLRAVLAAVRSQSVRSQSTSPPAPPPSLVVMSLSPQSRASLAHHFSLSPLDTARKLTTFLRSLGVAELFDAASALDFSLLEAQREFVQHYRSTRDTPPRPPSSTSPSPSPLPLPLLTSECPGWVCYAEKTQGAYILPHMSRVKSPQQVLGTLLKRWWSPQRDARPSDVFHVSVQPCFDKKLEGSRDEFFDPHYAARDVDLVLSTGELLQLIEEDTLPPSPSFVSLEPSPLSSSFNLPLRTSDSAASGGYADHVFRYAASELYGVTYPPGPLPWVQQRSTDSRELSLSVDGRRVLHFALMYGFRHLQSLVKAIKQGTATWDYVEVMACPGGCVNGGGQVKEQSKELRKQKELVRRVGDLYRGPQDGSTDTESDGGVRAVGDSELVREVYGSWLKSGVGGEEALMQLHTTFKAIEPTEVNPLTIKW